MKKGRILIVDDEYGIRTGVHQILELEGYSVEEATTGQQALAAIGISSFDIVLIDYRLPDIDGLTLLQAIRSRAPAVMTCMITAYANIETAIAATRQGIDFFLPKPFTPDDLIGVIGTLLRHKMTREEAEELRVAHEASLLELASEKSRTHSLVESLRDAVLVINRTGEVVLVNRAMVSLLKTDEALLLRQPVLTVLNDKAFAPVQEVLAASPTGKTIFEMEIGENRYMVSLSPFYSENSDILGHILTVSDISEIHRLTMEKTRFIRTMIHEFRSPLGAIKGIMEVALDKSLGDNLDLYLPLLARAEKRLDGMVDLIGNLLSLAQIEMGDINNADLIPVDVSRAINETWEIFRAAAEIKNLTFEVSVEPDLPGVIIVAEDLRTILLNLVGNAVKYNRELGAILVQVSRVCGEAAIKVADTGIGIMADNLPHIFDEFYREKRPETRMIEGNGLGLAIVKRLAERFAGRVDVVSTAGKGSTFCIYLPLSG